MIEVRLLNESELQAALLLVQDVFTADVAPCYSEEGNAEFLSFIEEEHVRSLVRDEGMLVWGAGENGELCGVLAVHRDGRIALFFVSEHRKREGIGRMLFQTAYNYCAQVLRISKMTIQASPNAVEILEALEMHRRPEEEEEGETSCVPMEIFVSSVLVKPVRQKKKRKVVIIGGVILGIWILLLLAWIGTSVIRYAAEKKEKVTLPFSGGQEREDEQDDENRVPNGGIYDGGEFGADDFGIGESEAGGIEAIEAYIDDDIDYEIQGESYEPELDEKVTLPIAIKVEYPSLKGIDGNAQEKINKALKDCAMQNVEKYYLNPSLEFKEKMLQEESPVLEETVTCKVCYASEEFLSVAFQDYGFFGSLKEEDFQQELRTLNINLKDGTVYEVKDILKLNENFLEMWLGSMRKEADNDALLSELGPEELKKTLSGEMLNDNYKVVYFAKEDGLEIGYNFYYAEDDPNNPGYSWVTAPLSFDELEDYETDSSFWDAID